MNNGQADKPGTVRERLKALRRRLNIIAAAEWENQGMASEMWDKIEPRHL